MQSLKNMKNKKTILIVSICVFLSLLILGLVFVIQRFQSLFQVFDEMMNGNSEGDELPNIINKIMLSFGLLFSGMIGFVVSTSLLFKQIKLSKTINNTCEKLMVYCPNCKKPNSNDATFCKECGSNLKKTCPVCQTINSIDSKYCTNCQYKFKE